MELQDFEKALLKLAKELDSFSEKENEKGHKHISAEAEKLSDNLNKLINLRHSN